MIRPIDLSLSNKAVFETVISMRHCFVAHSVKMR
jgi:hypothetical protein